MTVRFFGGTDYTEQDLHSPDMARIGYRKGVPMGGDLAPGATGAPVFMIAATRDPDGANLDRIQVVKGWLDKSGTLQEQVYNVAMSDGRKADGKGRVKPLESTVDASKATYRNDNGAAELRVLWQDPDFDGALRAVYYVRVLEIPTPRWTAYDQAFFGVDSPDRIAKEVQNRAYTSPIWYTP